MKIKICIEEECQNVQTSKNYCRLHYLKNWKKIKEQDKKKAVDRLNRYVEGICKKFPERYVDVIRRELKQEKGNMGGFLDDASDGDLNERIFEGFGFQDDEGVDQLLSKIKLDKDF